MKCFYHMSDLDGICSREIVKFRYPGCKTIPFEVDMKLKREKVEQNETTVLVDGAFSEDDMMWLRENTNFIWIDHHISSIRKFEKHPFFGLRSVGKAACELSWEYFFPGIETPREVYLLGRYDVWDKKDPDVNVFHNGMLSLDKETQISYLQQIFLESTERPGEWTDTREEMYSTIIGKGEAVENYMKMNREYHAANSFFTMLDGYRTLALNRKDTSEIFDSVWNGAAYDIAATFFLTSTGRWRVTLSTPKPDIDVSEIAKKYGGGGHRGCAGFMVYKLPFELGSGRKYV